MSVVFAAGFLVPQQIVNQDYFRGVANAFPGAIFPNVPVVADVRTRGNALAGQINALCGPGPIHIVAHSMAGLDSRFLLSQNLLGLAGRIVSLSMIATPHWGSPVADLLAGPQPSPIDPRRLAYDTFVEMAAELGQPAGALGDLTYGAAQRFNPQNPNVQGVNYYCYAGSGMESFFLKPAHFYIGLVGNTPEENANDGMVSVASASWTPLAEPPWNTDHFGEVGYNFSLAGSGSIFDHIAAYRRVLARAGA